MKTLTHVVVGIIIGIIIVVLAVGGGAYILLTKDGMVGTIDDALDEVSFSEEYRELNLLEFVNKAVGDLQDIENKTIGEVEKIAGTNGISTTIADSVGVSSGVIKTSSLTGLGETLSANLTLSGMSDSFGIALPEDIPLFNDESFLNEPVSDAFGTIDDYTLDSFIDVVYDDEATADNPASSGLLQNLGKLPLSELSSEMDSIIDNTYITDVLDVDESSSEIMKYLASGGEDGRPVKIGELDGAVNDMKIADAVNIDADSSPVLKYLRDCELTVTDEDGNVTIEIGASLNNINEAIKEMTIGDAVEIVSTSSLALKYMQNFKLDEMDSAIKNMKISDAVSINDDSHAVLTAIADLTLDNLSDGDLVQSKLDTLRLGQVIKITDSSPKILKALRYSRLGNIGEAVDRLEMQDLFEDIDTGVLALIDPATLIDDIPDELTKAIQRTTLFGLQQIDLFSYSIGSDDYYTLEKTLERVGTHNAKIGGVVQVIADRDFKKLTVGRVTLYKDDTDGMYYAYAKNDAGDVTVEPVEVDVGADGMVILDADDIDTALGVLAEESRYAAVITVDSSVGITVDSSSVGSNLTIAGGEYDTLFSIEMLDTNGNLWIGEADNPVSFPNKAGGYAFFHAIGSIHLNGSKEGIAASDKASGEDIPVATISNGTKAMTYVDLIVGAWAPSTATQ